MLLTIDSLIEGIDFDLAYCTPQDAGWKAMAVSLSDIGAMGGIPAHAVTALALPDTTPVAVAEGIAAGLAQCSRTYGVAMVGGDVSGASEIGIAVASTGTAERPVTRNGARQDDLLAVTGHLGGAAAGLAALRAGRKEDFPAPVERQLRPRPRLAEGAARAAAGVTAMIDLSDGLAPDLGHLIEASDVGCEVDAYALPVHRGAEEVAASLGELAVLDLAVAGGEDYELLFSFPPERLPEVRTSLRDTATAISVIGRITEQGATIGGRSLEEWKEKSWEHLRRR
jgi:thiamine-monophosphate kinase